jgi:hypothetical protein
MFSFFNSDKRGHVGAAVLSEDETFGYGIRMRKQVGLKILNLDFAPVAVLESADDPLAC